MIAYVDNKEKICQSLLGSPNIMYDNIVITPLRSIFEHLRASVDVPEVNNKGFYSNFSFVTKSGMFIFVICVPQGMQAQDVMYVLWKKKILLLGYAGSLSVKNNIGDIVETNKVFTEKGECIALSPITGLKKVSVGYSPVLVGELTEEYHSFARNIGCDIVDMETAYCARAAKNTGNIFNSLLLVSDVIGHTEFWELDKNDISSFVEGNNKLIELALAHYNRV